MLAPFPSRALYESFGRATCVLAEPQLPFLQIHNRALDSPSLRRAVSESSCGWPVASDYLLIGQRFRPTSQELRRTFRGAIHVSQTCGRVIALLRLEILQHVHRECISANQLCGNGFTPLQIEHSGTNADNNKASTRQPTQKCGRSSCLFPVANRIWFFQVRGPDSRSKCHRFSSHSHSPSSVSCPPCFSIHLQPRKAF